VKSKRRSQPLSWQRWRTRSASWRSSRQRNWTVTIVSDYQNLKHYFLLSNLYSMSCRDWISWEYRSITPADVSLIRFQFFRAQILLVKWRQRAARLVFWTKKSRAGALTSSPGRRIKGAGRNYQCFFPYMENLLSTTTTIVIHDKANC
jgi:hypothetical protein